MTDPEGQTDEPKDLRAKLEAANAALRAKDETIAQKDVTLADMAREKAFRDVGLAPDDPMAKFFAEKYDGDMTVEAITAEALKVGVLKPGEQTPVPDPSQQTQPPVVPGAVESPTAAPVMFESFTTGTEPSAAPPGLAEKIDAAARSGNQAELEQLLGANGLLAEQ